MHSIVLRAQNELSHLPERDRRNTVALFDVYDQILPTLGLDAVHDNRYAPILFKIGGMLGDGTLYDKFEAVLARMGIEIELDDGSSITSENAHGSQFEAESLFEPDSLAVGAPTPNAERRRRHSYSAIEDTDGKAPNGPTASSEGSISNTNIGGDYAERSFSAQAVLQPTVPVADVQLRGRRISHPPRLTLHRESRDRSTSKQRVRIRSSRSTHQLGSDYETRSSSPAQSAEPVDYTHTTAHSEKLQLDETAASTPIEPPGQSLHLPETFLDMRAELFYQRHSAIRATEVLRRWQAEQKHLQHLAILANNYDWKTLVYASFKAWRRKTANTIVDRYRITQQREEHERQEQEEAELQHQIEERDRYLEDLEIQAADARDQYFMKTILGRWNERAISEVEQTLAARRHILGKRYFTAWRELASSNEEKIRTHVLKKFFLKWRAQTAQNSANQELAIAHYEDHLVQRKLWEWWGRYGIVVISKKRELNVQRKYLAVWLGSALDIDENEHMASQYRRDQLVRKVWAIWRARTHEKQAVIQNKAGSIQLRIDQRLVRHKLLVWLWLTKRKVERRKRAEQIASERREKEIQATLFYRKQILKEAVSTWRYRLRSELVYERVDRNTVAQIMPKLILEARLRQFRRIKDTKLKQSALQLLFQKQNTLAPRRLENERLAKEHAAKRVQNGTLRQWLKQMHISQQRQKAANDFCIPHLLQNQLDQWTKKFRIIRRQQEWARDAEFFMATSKALKLWKTAMQKSQHRRIEASEAAKRKQRYSAYTQLRRKHKIRLAENIIQKWREKTSLLKKDNELALQVRGNRTLVLGMEIFDRWRARAEDLLETDALAETKYQETILRSTLGTWEEKFRGIESMQDDADTFYLRHCYGLCSQYIKEWSRRGFQIRAKENQIQANEKTAEEYRERCLRAAYRKYIRKWRTLTLEKRHLRGSALNLEPPGSVARKYSYIPGSISKFNTTAQAEDWTDFDEDGIENPIFNLEVDEASASTPALNSVRTPLRKSGILAPLIRASTTPKTPLATPFERKLREEYSGKIFSNSGQGLGKGIGKSGLSKSVVFADLPDKINKKKGLANDDDA